MSHYKSELWLQDLISDYKHQHNLPSEYPTDVIISDLLNSGQINPSDLQPQPNSLNEILNDSPYELDLRYL